MHRKYDTWSGWVTEREGEGENTRDGGWGRESRGRCRDKNKPSSLQVSTSASESAVITEQREAEEGGEFRAEERAKREE
jgi:hypothetical protein